MRISNNLLASFMLIFILLSIFNSLSMLNSGISTGRATALIKLNVEASPIPSWHRPAMPPVSEKCKEDWQCEGWHPNICPNDSIQTRSCIDKNECKTFDYRPLLIKDCVYVPLPIAEQPYLVRVELPAVFAGVGGRIELVRGYAVKEYSLVMRMISDMFYAYLDYILKMLAMGYY